MGTKFDEIITKFLVNILPNIYRETDYTTMNNIVQIIYRNATTLPTIINVWQHGHMRLIMKPKLCENMVGMPY